MNNGSKILIVDDSTTSLMMEKMILNQSGWKLVTASSGEEALARAEAERPDLILLDVVMPGIDGFEVCRRLRSQESTSTTPIIMVTTRGEERHLETGFESGCNDYVTKPLDGAELLSKVRALLGA